MVEDDARVRQRFAQAIDRSSAFELWFKTGLMRGALEWMSQCPREG